MLLAIAASVVVGIWAGNTGKGMTTGKFGIALGVAIICAVFNLIVGLITHSLLPTLLWGTLAGVVSYAGYILLSRNR